MMIIEEGEGGFGCSIRPGNLRQADQQAGLHGLKTELGSKQLRAKDWSFESHDSKAVYMCLAGLRLELWR